MTSAEHDEDPCPNLPGWLHTNLSMRGRTQQCAERFLLSQAVCQYLRDVHHADRLLLAFQ